MSYFPKDLLDAIGKGIGDAAGNVKDYVSNAGTSFIKEAKYRSDVLKQTNDPLVAYGPPASIGRSALTDFKKPIEDATNKLNFKVGNVNVPLGSALRTGVSFLTGGAYSPEEQTFYKKVNNRVPLSPTDVQVGKKVASDQLLNIGTMAGTLTDLPAAALEVAAKQLERNISKGITGANAEKNIFLAIEPYLKNTGIKDAEIRTIVKEIADSSKQEIDDVIAKVNVSRVQTEPSLPKSDKLPTEKGQFNVNYLADKTTAQKEALKNLQKDDVIGKMKMDEIKKIAETIGYDATEYTDRQIKEIAAKELKTRSMVATLETELRNLKANNAPIEQLIQKETEIANTMRISASQGTKAAIELRSRQIFADQYSTAKEKIYRLLDAMGLDPEKYAKKAVEDGVNWDDAKSVTKFYRELVPAKWSDLLSEYRYQNMLSSPLSQIVNTATNLGQTVLNPVTKLASGGIDLVSNVLGAKKVRTHFVGEAGQQVKGTVNAIPTAISDFVNTMKGNIPMDRFDVNRIPTNNPILEKTNMFVKLLDASDKFFRALIKGGEMESLAYKYQKMGKEVPIDQIAKEAEEKAAYWIFHKALDPKNKTGQGALLSSIDNWTSAMYGIRNAPFGDWIIPFIQTPMNILKQGVEFSPAGLFTLPGAKDKTEQLAKIAVGSAVMVTAAHLAELGDVTWSAPSGAEEKKKFFDSGRIPYAIKIGDNWYSFSKLGPLAYPIAFAAKMKYDAKYNPKAYTTNDFEKAKSTISSMLGFFANQSYMEQLGVLADTFKDPEKGVPDLLANFSRQVVPQSSLLSWVARMMDDTYRKADSVKENVMSGIPKLSEELEPYTKRNGKPSKRPYPIFNSFSPIQKSPSGSKLDEQIYQSGITKQQSSSIKSKIKSGDMTLKEGMEQRKKLLRESRLRLTPR